MANNVDYFLFLIFATIVFVILAGVFVALFVRYKKRIFRQFFEAQEAKEAYQKELFRSNLETQENERRRFARDLHDELGSILSMLKMKILQAQTPHATSDENALSRVLLESTRLTEAAMASARRISHELLPGSLEDFGLLATLEDYATSNSHDNLQIRLNADINIRLSTSIEVNIYRIVMELITNSVKHGEATVIDIQFTQDEKLLEIVYIDNGTGFDAGSPGSRKGLGLKNMESRALHLNGKIRMMSSPGNGTRAEIEIPLETVTNA